MALNARFFSKVWSDHIDLNRLRADQAVASLLVAVYTTKAGTQVAIPEMSVGEGSFTGGID